MDIIACSFLESEGTGDDSDPNGDGHEDRQPFSTADGTNHGQSGSDNSARRELGFGLDTDAADGEGRYAGERDVSAGKVEAAMSLGSLSAATEEVAPYTVRVTHFEVCRSVQSKP